MTSCVRVLTAASLDSSPSLLLVAPDGSKVLIDCGEGCQRAFIEGSQKVATVQAICLTKISHTTVGGLPGFLLTSSDIRGRNVTAATATPLSNNDDLAPRSRNDAQWPFAPMDTSLSSTLSSTAPQESADLNIFGPSGSGAYLTSLRHFVRRDTFRVRLHEHAVHRVAVAPSTASRSKAKKKVPPMTPPSPDNVRFTVTTIPFVDVPDTWHVPSPLVVAGQKRPRAHDAHAGQASTLSFLFTTPPLLGKFLPEEAAKLGVPKGPLYAKLKGGQSVTFTMTQDEGEDEQDITVHSHQVVTPASPGIAVLVLRYPPSVDQLADYLKALRITERLTEHNVTLDVVVHLATEQVFTSKCATAWRHGLTGHTTTQHLWMNVNDEAGTPHHSAASTAQVRADLCPGLYYPLDGPVGSVRSLVRHPSLNGLNDDEKHVVQGRPGTEYVLLPRVKRGFRRIAAGLDKDEINTTQRKQLEDSGARQLADEIIQKEKALRQTESSESLVNGELIFTGTASAIPCKYRNVTGMSLVQPDGRAMLLDVGEGTLGQLFRLQRSADPSQVLGNIRVAWISHPHADHHLGLVRLLEERVSLSKASPPLLLICPPPVAHFLEEYARINPHIRGTYQILDCRDFRRPNPAAVGLLKAAIGFSNCRVVQVEHCQYSYAIILDGTPFGRLVYSGDCRPCAALARVAQPVDLLIHEATFEDGMESEAFLKRHCTTGEALRMGRAMQAKTTVLTHFSQRYPRISPPSSVDTTDMTIIYAFDGQCLTPQTLRIASKMTPALRKLYPEDDPEEAAADEVAERQSKQVLSTPGLFAKSELL
jgi:ribonuclease Z